MLKFIEKIKKERKAASSQKGMTYIELIVVLSIFSVMTSIVLFNYGDFQAKVDVKNLGTDIALKAVEAQKTSLSGKLPPIAQRSLLSTTWKPSYGVYFNILSDNKSFIYFSDLNNDTYYNNINCVGVGECLDIISITKGNYISSLDVFYQGDPTPHSFNDLMISYSRPNSGAIVKSSTALSSTVYYVQITVVSPKSAIATSKIKLYASGRIQVN